VGQGCRVQETPEDHASASSWCRLSGNRKSGNLCDDDPISLGDRLCWPGHWPGESDAIAFG
jgi:hypothetical protein